jgi:hypothetical protein
MTARRAVLFLLLVFVTTSTFYLLARNKKSSPSPASTEAAPTSATSAPKVIAYYFHLTVRCTTCRTIEAYSREAILNHFKSDIERGRLEWQVVNVELPENEHFVKDYQLFTKSVVLVHIANGKQQSYKTLNDVWELVGDKARFQAYVDKEVRGYLAQL